MVQTLSRVTLVQATLPKTPQPLQDDQHHLSQGPDIYPPVISVPAQLPNAGPGPQQPTLHPPCHMLPAGAGDACQL